MKNGFEIIPSFTYNNQDNQFYINTVSFLSSKTKGAKAEPREVPRHSDIKEVA